MKLNFKKSILTLVFVIMLLPASVFANDSYQTANGCVLTAEEYANLTESLTNEELDSLPCEMLDLIKHDDNIKVFEKGITIATTEGYKSSSTIISNSENGVELIPEYTGESISPLGSFNGQHETTYKYFYVMATTSYSGNSKILTVGGFLNWKQMPKIRNLDMFGILINSGTIGLSSWDVKEKLNVNTEGSSITCSVILDRANTKGYAGIFYISEAANDMLSYTMTTRGNVIGSPTTVTVSYQHDGAGVTYSQAEAFTFSSSGYGGVFNYTTSAGRNAYDQMRGVTLNISW